jgi:hypothetical protein
MITISTMNFPYGQHWTISDSGVDRLVSGMVGQ